MLQQVGKYQIKRELGRGTSSTVYLAYDEFLNADLALKLYGSEDGVLDARMFQGQFVSEAALAGRLVHPHIVTIIDAAVDAGRCYVAMEYVPGGNLSRHTRAERLLPVDDVVQIAFKCCGALDYAHRAGVVHRDIKPGNVLVEQGTDVKVADFGAAWVRDVETTQRLRMGSPSYASPEQILDHELTHRSDMFSLGVLLYQLLTGLKPFKGASTADVLDSVLKHDPVAPSSLRAELPRALDEVVARMLQKSPQDRHAGWAELALDLARVGRLSVYDQAVRDSEKYTALRTAPLLQALTDAELWELARIGRWRRVAPQTAVIREGEVGDSLFLLAEGEAKVTLQGKLLDVLRAGDVLGEMAYVRGEAARRQATVETTKDALVVELPRAGLEGLSAGCQLHLARALLRTLADRLAFSNARVART
jgi:tRNA A-37 threonylcarbamoyl transferase component Bud32